jgi:hypothetical protein
MILARKLTVLFIASLILLFSCKKKEPGPDPVVETGFPSHPRILLLKGEETIIKDNLNADPTWKAVHNLIITECNATLSKPPVERVLIGKRLLDKSQTALKRIFYLSYGFRMTLAKTYLDRAVAEMNAIAAFSDWNPSHFLDVAEMTMAMSIGYDWLYRELDPASRIKFRDAIINKGLQPSYNSSYNWFLTSTNNWNQVCNAGMTYGALAIWDDDSTLAKNVINRAMESIKLPMSEYVPDGAYPEGYGYWGYGTSFNVMFISAWEKAFKKSFDVPQNNDFLKTGGYLLHMAGPTLSAFNYSDCGTGTGLNISQFWFAQRTNDFSILKSEKTFLGNLKSAGDRLLPAVLLWSNGMKISEVTSPAGNFWIGGGKNPVSLMRTSWTDPNALYVAIKGGTPKNNHGHMDVGSFVMDANGVRWAMDFGMQDYNSLESAGVDLWNSAQTSERWTVFRYNNLAHSTLTINGQLQRVDGMATFSSHSSTANMMNAITDISQVYSTTLKSAVRGIAIVDGQYVTVRDEVETNASAATIRWNMVTSADVVLGSDYATLTKSGKTLTLKVAGTASVTMKTWTTVSPNSYDAANPGTYMVGFETVVPANTKAALQVYLIPGGVTQNPVTIPGALSTWPK